MFVKTLVQAMLAMSLIHFVPVNGSVLEFNASLPTAAARSTLNEAFNVATHAVPGLPQADNRFPTKIDSNSLGVVTTARSVLVIDRTTGLPLYAKNADSVRPIGSISKLMAMLVFLESKPDFNAPASIQPQDYRNGGRLYLAMDDPITIQDIWQAALVGSDNTAVMALVRLSGKSDDDFVARMNQKAAELGMTSTAFRDPTGLSPQNVSTAQDLVKLLNAVYQVPEISDTITLSQVTITQASGRRVVIDSTDELFDTFLTKAPYHLLGGKTGYLPEAGYCMAIGVGHDGEGDVLIILLGSETKGTRVQEIKGLADWAYKVFQWPS